MRTLEEVKDYIQYTDIPHKYLNATIDKFNPATKEQKQAFSIIKKFSKNLDTGENLYFYGEFGSGKTYCSILAANMCYQQEQVNNYYYIKTSMLLSAIKEDFNNDYGKDKKQAFNKAVTTPLLILDEFCRGDLNSEFDRATMFNIIDERYSNNLSTIFVSNTSKEELSSKVDKAVFSRIIENTTFVNFGKKDLRFEKRV